MPTSSKNSRTRARAKKAASGGMRGRVVRMWQRRWVRYLLGASVIAGVAIVGTLGYLYVSFGRMIDARLHGERERTLPRVYGRPVTLRRGQLFSEAQLVSRLNDLGYAQRSGTLRPGEFTAAGNLVTISPRAGDLRGTTVRISLSAPAARRAANTDAADTITIAGIELAGGGKTDAIQLDAPLLTALMTSGAREKRRHVPLSTIPKPMQQAVLAIEDQSFYSHPGLNPVRLAAAAITNVFGRRQNVVGYSTITQQLARMFFLEDEFNAELQSGSRGRTWGSYLRKLREMWMSLVLERRATKDEILELYLNDVYLGQRGSFAIHGVAEASRIFFGRDVANLTIAQAAVIAGVIQSPASRSPFTNAKRAVERRDLVIGAMAEEGYVTEAQAARARREPLQVVARAVDNEAPYFVDMVGQQVADTFPGLTAQPGAIDVYTTLDINLQRAAIEAVRRGLASVDQQLAARRRRRTQPAQAALIAVDPRTGEILAMVGGRSYNQSQFNRAVVARRQPGSVVKPFVFLAAFERALEEGRSDLTPASLTLDEPAQFDDNGQVWEPRNYDDYDGEITWRRALAMSRNIGTIRVGEQIGFDRIAALWKRIGVGTAPQPYPSITLGVFELTPLEVAQAYTLFTNGGAVRPLRALDRIDVSPDAARTSIRTLEPKPATLTTVARPDSTFLVTNMMQSVINEGTGASARGNGFALTAAGKSGTTNDLRDAWFVGFTPELLTVTWVGYDDNQPLGLSGTQAALPIWTDFMKTALAGHANRAFQPPDGITFVEIDRDTGKLAVPGCPRTFTESFAVNTEPFDYCELHR